MNTRMLRCWILRRRGISVPQSNITFLSPDSGANHCSAHMGVLHPASGREFLGNGTNGYIASQCGMFAED